MLSTVIKCLSGFDFHASEFFPKQLHIDALFSIAWFVAKVFSFLLLYIWVRGTLPRFRYDQLMGFGWKFLLPVSMVNILATALALTWHG